jgi:diguanylate cyclase (GGDEF)-like protein
LSPIPQALVTAAGGILAGLALSGALLWQQHRLLARVRYEATHDDTTGLPNRRAALAHVHRTLADGRPLGVVLLDLDSFKAVNDAHGHQAGNQVLTEIGWRLAALPAPMVLAARLSGDEFALIVHGNPHDVESVARAAFGAVAAAPVAVGDHTLGLTASVGYACAHPGVSAAQLLHDADTAMYRAKTTGGGVRGLPAAPTGTTRRCRDRR